LIDIRRRTTLFFLAVSLGHVLLISAQVQSKAGNPVASEVAFGAFAGVQRVLGGGMGAVSSLWHNYFALRGAAAENALLRERIAQLEGQVQAEAAISRQTRALEAILQMQMSVTQPTVAARVIAGSPAPGAQTIMIDRGSADGVRANLAVIAPGGIVGRVLGDPQAHASMVQLITGRNAGAGAVIERVAAGGVVEGTGGDPALTMQYVPNSFEVREGDRVVTSGQDGIYPPGFVVGTVTRADRGNLMQRIALRPAVNFTHLDVVLVVLQAPAAGGAQ
jgi:rod shape-determining protein MreC